MIHYLPNVYRSETLILVVPQRVPESYVRSTVTTRIEDRLQSISQQILSRTRLERIIQDFNLYPKQRAQDQTHGRHRRADAQRTSASTSSRATRSASASRANDPRTAMRVTERLASLFIDESLRDREVLAEGTNQFLEAQLDDARRQLDREREASSRSTSATYDGELPTQLDANMQGLHNTEMQLQALGESLNRDRDRRLLLERTVADVLERRRIRRRVRPGGAQGQRRDRCTRSLQAAQQALQRDGAPAEARASGRRADSGAVSTSCRSASRR